MNQKAGYIKTLVTGGRETLVEQQEKGGEPTCCEVFKEVNKFLKPKAISTMRHSCRAGKRLCSECKTELANYYHQVK